MRRSVSFFHVGRVPDYVRGMVESVREHMPNWPIVQMTDERCEPIAGVTEVIRKPFDGLLSKCRIEHIRDYAHEEMLILDTDIVMKGSVEHVFDDEFDVAFTKRRRPVRTESGYDMTRIYPYNCGVMFSRSHEFWVDAVTFLEDECPREIQQWGGEQLCMNVIAERGRFDVLDLPVERYNFTPIEADDVSDAFIWHYKGTRKEWLKPLQ